MVDNLSTFLGISCQEKIGMGRPQFAEYGIFAEISGAQTVNFQVQERLGGSQVHILLPYFGKLITDSTVVVVKSMWWPGAFTFYNSGNS